MQSGFSNVWTGRCSESTRVWLNSRASQWDGDTLQASHTPCTTGNAFAAKDLIGQLRMLEKRRTCFCGLFTRCTCNFVCHVQLVEPHEFHHCDRPSVIVLTSQRVQEQPVCCCLIFDLHGKSNKQNADKLAKLLCYLVTHTHAHAQTKWNLLSLNRKTNLLLITFVTLCRSQSTNLASQKVCFAQLTSWWLLRVTQL